MSPAAILHLHEAAHATAIAVVGGRIKAINIDSSGGECSFESWPLLGVGELVTVYLAGGLAEMRATAASEWPSDAQFDLKAIDGLLHQTGHADPYAAPIYKAGRKRALAIVHDRWHDTTRLAAALATAGGSLSGADAHRHLRMADPLPQLIREAAALAPAYSPRIGFAAEVAQALTARYRVCDFAFASTDAQSEAVYALLRLERHLCRPLSEAEIIDVTFTAIH